MHAELYNTHSPSAITLLPKVIERIPVMLFAGDQDFICNYVGQEALIQAMAWNGATGLGVRVLPSLVLCSLTHVVMIT